MSTFHPVNYNELYDFSDPLANRPLRLEAEQEWMSNERSSQLDKGEWRPPEPVRLKAYMGGQATDVLWTGQLNVCISDRVLDVLEKNKFTGWATYPVEVFGRKGEFLPGYHGLSITSYASEIDRSRSQIIVKSPVPGTEPRTYYRGIFFDESKWDGSDFFRLTGSWTVVKKTVRDVFKREKIINVKFTSLAEYDTLKTE